ncbi:MAG: CRISPR-associated ring nuclease, partial [Chloroflexota bacterium]
LTIKTKLAEIIATTKYTVAEKLPQLASAAATGLVPLSLGLALANIIQSSPEDVFIYLAGLAPNFMSDMLLSMRLQEKPVDAEAIAVAVAERLDDSGVRRLAEELEVLDGLVLAMSEIQAQNEQLRRLSQTFIQEMKTLQERNWTIPPTSQTVITLIEENMVAQGQFIAQARDRSIANVIVGDHNILNYQTKRFVRILVGNIPNDELWKKRQAIIVEVVEKIRLADCDLDVRTSQAVSLGEASQEVKACDIYIRLFGAQPWDGEEILEFEIGQAHQLGKPVLLYYQELVGNEVDQKQESLSHLKQNSQGYIHEFGIFDEPADWGRVADSHLRALLPSSDFKARQLPTSNKRGLIASVGRSPGAVTGLYYALQEKLRAKDLKIDYVWTISTADPEVSRSVATIRDELKAQPVNYENTEISAKEFRNERDVLEFKRAFVALLNKARRQGDAVAIGVTGGRTVMGTLLAQVAQMEAPANSAFYHLDVPNGIEEDGRYPRFANQSKDYQQTLLNPMKFMPRVCHLVEISFNHFYADVYGNL